MTETIRLGAGTLVRPEEEEGRCWVGKGLDGNRCPRASAWRIYGLPMCKEHGAEAREGALEEVYYDAAQELERPLNPHTTRPLNPALSGALGAAARELYAACNRESGSTFRDVEEALVRAFPLEDAGGRVDPDTIAEVEDPDAWRGYETPLDYYLRHRDIIHKLMRLAFEEGYTVVVEMLEREREEVASQAAYAVALDRRNRPQPE